MGSTTSAQPKEKEQSQTAPEKKGDHVESERFTEEEKASLNANKFVMLPCYPNPFADYGQNTRTVKADASVLSSGRSWESIVVLMERDLIDPGVLCAVLKDLSGTEGEYFRDHFKDPTTEIYQEFFKANEGTLARMQRLAIRMPTLFPDPQSLPLLLPQIDLAFSLSKEQIACLLAATFFGIVESPAKYSLHSFSSYGFDVLYDTNWGTVLSTLDCILHYFERVTQQELKGNMSFHRQVVPVESLPDWASSTKRIIGVKTFDQGIIEDSAVILHVDFANANIGGGISRGGNAQEEIMFATKTECIISQLFCAQLQDNEVLFITGAEKFSAYKGYGRSFTWVGDYIDHSPRDEEGNIATTIVAMDAVRTIGGQFDINLFHRDLNKAYNGFSCRSKPGAVATGNWGCGVFGGDKSVKFFQQLLAASEAGREELHYYTFDEAYYDPSHKLSTWINDVMHVIDSKGMTVGELYKIVTAGLAEKDMDNMFEWLLQS